MVLKSRVAAKVRPSNSSVKKIIIKTIKSIISSMMLVERCLYKVATNAILEQCMFPNVCNLTLHQEYLLLIVSQSFQPYLIDCMSQPALYVCEIKAYVSLHQHYNTHARMPRTRPRITYVVFSAVAIELLLVNGFCFAPTVPCACDSLMILVLLSSAVLEDTARTV